MHASISAFALLFLSTTVAAHGPYIPSGSGSLPKYPTGTAPYPTTTGTGILPPYPTAITSLIESATTCPLPKTVTVTTDVTVTVTVPPGSGGTGTAAPSASAGLKVRRGPLEMRGLGEREARGFWG